MAFREVSIESLEFNPFTKKLKFDRITLEGSDYIEKIFKISVYLWRFFLV